jgi:glycosyltransferase involved in cell wall biosynthesis
MSTVSVVLTTYAGDEPSALQQCLESLREQKRKPDNVVIVRDKNLPTDLASVISEFLSRASFDVKDISIEDQGRGHARKVGVRKAESEFVAVIDADDIATPNRISAPLEFLQRNPTIDVVGGYIGEFEETPDRITSIRQVPTEPAAVRRTAYYRSPLNHQTVTFHRSAVLDVGNYRNMEYGEDYELWCRLLARGKQLANIPEMLVKARATELMERRTGLEIARLEVQLQRAIVETGFFGWNVALPNIALRVPLRLLPKRLLFRIYRRLLRQ